jgi:hypothetical protein
MAQIKISVINSSKELTDDKVSGIMGALQKQVREHFAPQWGIDADLDFVPKGKQAPAEHWWLAILDDSDSAGKFGYHDLNPRGLPLGKVFAGADIRYGASWTVTASHELLEMLVDPGINLTAMDLKQRLYAYEVCDACEADEYAYKIDGILVSDFVYPAWFEPLRAANSTQFDRQNHINEPLQLLPGGFISVYDMVSGTGWQQIYGRDPDNKKPSGSIRPTRAPVGSRRERRRTPANHWLKSHPNAGTSGMSTASEIVGG